MPCRAVHITSAMPSTIPKEDDMQTAIHSIPSKAQRSWKHPIGLPALVLLMVAAAAIFGLLTLGAQPASQVGHAGSSDMLRLQQAVKDLDEAAASAGWAQMQAMDRAGARG